MGNVHMEHLKQLSELHKSGALTDDEFASKKAEILALAPIGFVEEDREVQEPEEDAQPSKNNEEPLTAGTVFGGLIGLAIIVAIIWGIVAVVSAARNPEPMTCEGIVRQVVRLSEKNENAFSGRILKLSQIEQLRRSSTELQCQGYAKLSRGASGTINFYWLIDEDGDTFIGYEGQ